MQRVEQHRGENLRYKRGHGGSDGTMSRNQYQIQRDIEQRADDRAERGKPSETFRYIISALRNPNEDEQNRPTVNDEDVSRATIV